MRRILLCVFAFLLFYSKQALASEISLKTPCSVISSAVKQNDIIAAQETRSLIVQYLLRNDRKHIINNQDQFEAIARESAGRCIQGESGSLQSSINTTYQHWVGMVYEYQNQERAFIDKQNQNAIEHHQRVMKDLGQ